MESSGLVEFEECGGLSYTGGAGKTTLVNWLVKYLLEHRDPYGILPVYIRVKPKPTKAITSARDAIEFLAENGVEEYFKGRDIKEFLEKARLGLSID